MASPLKELLALDPTREQVEVWCRQRAQAVPVGNDALLCRVLGKYLMYVHQRDSALTPHLAMNGIWEPWITMAIARHLKPGMRCLDVGACYGYYALLMADIVGETGYVEAWEPVWRNTLAQNVALNGANVKTVGRVMSSNPEQRFRVRSLPERGLFNAGDVGMYPKRSPDVLPDTDTTTDATSGKYDFIKIDVEGAEMDVWTSLCFVRQVSHNLTVCMEFTPKQHKDPRVALESIVADGFTMGSVGHDGVPRLCTIDAALEPDTGDFRMLWLTRTP